MASNTLFSSPLYFHGIKMNELYTSNTVSKNISILENIITNNKEELVTRIEALYYIIMLPNYSSYTNNTNTPDSMNTSTYTSLSTNTSTNTSLSTNTSAVTNTSWLTTEKLEKIISDSIKDENDKFFFYTKIIQSSVSVKLLFVDTKSDEIKSKCVNWLWNRLSNNEKKIMEKYKGYNTPNKERCDEDKQELSCRESSSLQRQISFINDVRYTIFNFSLASSCEIKISDMKQSVLDYYKLDRDRSIYIEKIVDEYFNNV